MNRRLGLGIGAFCIIVGFALMDACDEAAAGLLRRQGGYYAGCSGCGGCSGCYGCSGRHRRHHRRRGCCGSTYAVSCCGTMSYCGADGCGACGTSGCCDVMTNGSGAAAPMEAPPPAPEASPSDNPPEAPAPTKGT